jgi:hypothetical protein
MKLPRWRPECPECGYSLRGLTEDRCPECGEPFPTTQRTFRRWAIRRLPWDRRHRTSLLRAYFTTVFLILFCPWKAARGLVIPDRWGRAVRWAVSHALAAAALDALATGPQQELGVIIADSWPDWPGPWLLWWADRRALWFAQGVAIWLLMLGSFPLLGALLYLGWGGEHQAARWGNVKWCLYCSIVAPLFVSAWIGGQIIMELSAYGGGGDAVRGFFFIVLPLPSSFPILLAAIAFSLWAGVGAAVNPYRRKRGPGRVLWWAGGFCAAWFLFSYVLFPLGVLGDLL